MKITDLPSPYRELAEMRHDKTPIKDEIYYFLETNGVDVAFVWYDTPEGTDFWAKVNIGQLPEIPASSLKEFAEWQKSKGEQPTLIGGKTDTEWIYLFAGQANAEVYGKLRRCYTRP